MKSLYYFDNLYEFVTSRDNYLHNTGPITVSIFYLLFSEIHYRIISPYIQLLLVDQILKHHL